MSPASCGAGTRTIAMAMAPVYYRPFVQTRPASWCTSGLGHRDANLRPLMNAALDTSRSCSPPAARRSPRTGPWRPRNRSFTGPGTLDQAAWCASS